MDTACSVYIEPPGRSAFQVELIGEPAYSEAAMGGCLTASFDCVAPPHRDRLLDARVRIHPPKGHPWIGRASILQQSGKVVSVTCTGPQHDLSRFRREALYCDTRVGSERWVPRGWDAIAQASPVRDNRIRIASEVASITGSFQEGQSYAALAWNGLITQIPWTTSMLFATDYARTNNNFGAQVGIGYGDTVYNWTQHGSIVDICPAGSGGTGGSFSQTFTREGGFNIVRLVWRNRNEVSAPSGERIVRLDNLKIYGVAGLTSITPSNVIKDVCSRLPEWVMPAGDEALAWVGTDNTVVEPFVSAPEDSELTILENMAVLRDYDIGFYARLVAGRYQPVPVYGPRRTTPSYQVFPSDGASLDITGADITDRASAVRVFYTGRDGRRTYTDVTSTSDNNYLVAIGQDKLDVLDAPTNSPAIATSIGQRYLAMRARPQVSGTLTLTAPIVDMNGAELLPCQVSAGHLVRMHGTIYGMVDARITQVEKTGAHQAVLTFNNTPTALDAELAMRAKRQQR